MAVLLALCSAATYGIGDFFGGMATRRAATAAVVLWSHVIGLTLLTIGPRGPPDDPVVRRLEQLRIRRVILRNRQAVEDAAAIVVDDGDRVDLPP